MKKITALILALIMILPVSLFSCASDDPAPDTSDDTAADGSSNAGNSSSTADPLSAEKEDPQFEYVTTLFGSGIIDIQITADSTAWQEMLDNAANEEYISCDVVVNGVEFKNVGIRPKGNSSLSQVVSSDSDRYSFRLKFDKYVDGQTCFGLSTFVVNNMISDSSYMKEYISFGIMDYIGVNSALFEFANISVNGEAWGFYLAIEKYDDEFLIRNYGNDKGELYNVKMSEMGGGRGDFQINFNDGETVPAIPDAEPNSDAVQPELPADNGGNIPSFTMPEGMTAPDGISMAGPTMPENTTPVNEASEDGALDNDTQTRQWNRDNMTFSGADGGELTMNFGGGMGAGNSGGSLEYTDDDPESYSAIFDNNVSKIDDDDKAKVIEALKALSEGRDLEEYFDVDQILRYFAAHTVVVNLDSYVSNMAQNFYLFEKGGKLTILPWDYNLAFGGFQGGGASDTVNFPIDTPVSGVTMESRPLLSKLLENEEYMERYHQYLQMIVTGYLSNIDDRIAELKAVISSYVESDPSKFCTYEEYEKAVETLQLLIELRTESIQGQLGGTVPSTTEGQKADPAALIDSSSVNMNDLGNMGSMNAGGMRAGNDNAGFVINGKGGMTSVDQETMQKAMEIISGANGNITDEIKQQLKDLGLTDEMIEMFTRTGNNTKGFAPNNT